MNANTLHFNTIGFDRLVERLNSLPDIVQNTYPPYNIIKTGDDDYIIEIALAGFKFDELDISLSEHILTVTGTPNKEDKTYIHKGIASRAFTRKFTLADTVEVVGADIEAGMLNISLKNIIPESKKERKIVIGPTPKPLEQLLNE